jgi:hypothetical protein
MSLLTLPAALALLTAAPAQPAAPAFRLHEGLPAGFAADGKLDEWKQPPSATLGASSQVAGKSKVASPDDFSAKVWLAISPEGLAVAGEVRDERVLLPEKAGDINADHVEVWLALPQPVMPPLAFVNQFGDQLVPTADACTEAAQEDKDGCRKWWKEQTARRKKLVQAFTVQYGLLPSGVTRFDGTAPAGTVRYEPMPGGYRFEALIPSGLFPRSAQAPLRDVRVLLDVVDNDEGRAKQESFLSSSPRRRFGDASTFHAVKLAAPLRFGGEPELLEKVLAQEGASYQPGPIVGAFQVWHNPPQGYQYDPSLPSPAATEIPLAPKVLGKLGDVELVTVGGAPVGETEFSQWLVSRKGRTVLHTMPLLRDEEVRTVARPPGLHVLRVRDSVLGYLGTGMCGGCPVINLNLVKMGPDGRFSEPEELEGGGDTYSAFTPKFKAAPDLSTFEVYGDYGDEKPQTPYVSRYTWNAKAGKYEHFLQAPPPEQASDTP